MSAEWMREEGVLCVVCPECAFTFDAIHTGPGEGYTCPLCHPEGLDELRRDRDRALDALDGYTETFDQECGRCRRLFASAWWAPNELWERVCGPYRILCTECFALLADHQAIVVVFCVQEQARTPQEES